MSPSSDSHSPAIDWSAAIAAHERWLRTVVFARVGDREAVDDVMQEVALAAVRQSSPLRDADKLAPWLYRLAIRQCLLYRRTCGRRRKLTNRFVEAVPPSEHDSSSVDPLNWLLADERRRMIRIALDRMPARDAEILLLKYIENWSYHQIARHLGLSHSAVEARLHRARQRLRTELGALQVIEVSS